MSKSISETFWARFLEDPYFVRVGKGVHPGFGLQALFHEVWVGDSWLIFSKLHWKLQDVVDERTTSYINISAFSVAVPKTTAAEDLLKSMYYNTWDDYFKANPEFDYLTLTEEPIKLGEQSSDTDALGSLESIFNIKTSLI